MSEKQKEQLRHAMKSFGGARFGQCEFKVKDADKGQVEAVFARFNVKDHDYDLTLPGAFEEGAKVLISAYGHRSWMGQKPVGRGTIHADGEKAWLEGEFFMDTIEGKDTFLTIKGTGELQEWSYGYDVLETGEVTEDLRQRGIYRVIKKSRVYEVCPVMLGAGVDTETVDIKDRRIIDVRDAPPSEKTDAPTEPTAEELAIKSDARREFAQFSKTRAGLARVGLGVARS
jgi:HK97 family phage prohead protease